jgi:hypothetical protein
VSNRNTIEQEVLTQRFIDEWVPLWPSVPVKYENRNFTPTVNEPWVAFTIRSGKVADAAISSIMPRGIGIVFLQIFLPENAGTSLARQMADNFADVFDSWHTTYPANGKYPQGDFWFKRTEFTAVPQREGWLQWNVSIEFKHDEQIVTAVGPPW